jgi:ubiquinone/menaquinone biosynthesis C-methylase UbiE
MDASGFADPWAQGATYESYMGRWSRPVARVFLTWLAAPPGLKWLDVGCGTGALSHGILEASAPRAVAGMDPSAGFVGYARRQIGDTRARFVVGDARALPWREGRFDVVVSGLVLNFVSDPAAAMAEMRRVARPGATVAAYLWDYAGRMEMLRYFWDAAVALDPRCRSPGRG